MSDLKNHIFVECQIEVEIAEGYQVKFKDRLIYLPKSDATADGNGIYVTPKLYDEKFAQGLS
jgi:hypothetical protein